jgi:branched-chain amino acid transport system substrate-binding protein
MRSPRLLLLVGLAATLGLGMSACGGKKRSIKGPPISGATLTVYSSLPLQGAAGTQSEAIVNGAKLAVSDAGGRVGRYRINYIPLDDSTAAAGAADPITVAANARKAAGRSNTIGYIGEFNSGDTKISLPILNRAGIAQVSPSNTYVGLTTSNPGSTPGEPGRYYPTGKRTFARIVPADDVQGAALATATHDAGCKTIHIWNSGTTYGAGLARNLARAASKIVGSRPGPAGGRLAAPTHLLKVEGNDRIDPKASNYRDLAAKINASCFVFTGEIESNAVQVFKDVAAAHPAIKLFGSDGVVTNALASPTTGLPPAVAARFEGTIATLNPAKFDAAGQKFFSQFDRAYNTTSPDPYAIYGYESMALLLDAIKRAASSQNGSASRAGVVSALLSTKKRQSVIGTYSIDANGDTTLTDYGLYRIAAGRLAFARVIKANANLT